MGRELTGYVRVPTQIRISRADCLIERGRADVSSCDLLQRVSGKSWRRFDLPVPDPARGSLSSRYTRTLQSVNEPIMSVWLCRAPVLLSRA